MRIFMRAIAVAGLVGAGPASAPAQTTPRPMGPPDLTAEEQLADAQSLAAVAAGRWHDALPTTTALIESYGERPAYLSRLADIYDRMHRPADEIAAWERFMAVSPRPAQACPMVGKAYRGLGQYAQAVDAFRRCLQADPANAMLVYYVGLGHEWAGEFGPAKTYYERAVAMAPPGYESRVSIARLDLHQGALTAARDRAVAVLDAVPTHVEAALVAGLAEQRAGHRVEARVYLEKAAELAPEYFDVRLALGILDYSDARIADARRHFEAAFLADPGRRADVQAWLDRTAAPK